MSSSNIVKVQTQSTHLDTSRPRKAFKFGKRSIVHEMQILYEFLTRGVDREDYR